MSNDFDPGQIGPDEPVTDDLVPSLVKFFCGSTTVKAVNKVEREVAHLITTKSPDRVGDIVEAGGSDLSNYLKHPVVMANHSYDIRDIIGRAVTLTIEDTGIFARTKYRDTPLGREAFALVQEGLGAWSIGFRPIAFKAMKDEKGYTKGFHYTQWEMLEYSQVAIPMNADVVQNAISRGWVAPENVNKFFQVEQPVEPREKASHETNAEPVPREQTLSRLSEVQLRRLTVIDRIIGGHRVWEQSAHLGE